MLGIDPLTQALLAASGGMLASSGPSLVPQSFGSAAGRGMLTGLNAYNDARIVNQKEALGNLHMQGMQQSLEDAKRSRAAIEAFAAQLPADQRGLFLANPQAYIKSATETRAVSPGQSLVRGNTPIYTAPPNLQPVDTGSGIMPWNPQTGAAGAAVIPKTMTPGESARHDWDRFTFNNLSAQQRGAFDRQDRDFNQMSLAQRVAAGQRDTELGMQGLNTYYNTGMLPGGLPTLSSIQGRQQTPPFTAAPSAAPMASISMPVSNVPPFPQPATNSAGLPLSPKMIQEVAASAAKQKAEAEGKREFNMSGLTDAITKAETILKGGSRQDLGGKRGQAPTGSGIGAGADWVASLFGYAPPGAAEAAQLKTIAGVLVAKMPRMEGPQSDRDAQLYREAAGDIGDASKPTAIRLAALKTVRELHGKYDKSAPNAAPGVPPGIDPKVWERMTPQERALWN